MNQSGNPVSEQDPLACLVGGGEMGALMRSLDWSKTPLGPVESWSPTLQTTVRTLLVNRFPLLLWWGPRYVQLYNDAYRPIPGAKHPRSLGQPASECWPEIWHIIGPLIDTPFQGGPATWMEDILLEVNRHGFVEETHFTIAYSPVPDEAAPGGIGGVLGTVHEITEKAVGERRMAALRDLGTRPVEAKTAEAACDVAATTLAAHDKDVPFALLYLTDADGTHARLAGAAGVSPGKAISPQEVELGTVTASPWPLAEAMRTKEVQTVTDLGTRFPSVPPGPWSDPPNTAVMLPIRSNKAHEVAGFLVAGVSARLRLDEAYRGFLELATAQVATAIANARAYEEEKKRAEALAELDQAKTAFFSNVSHEFRTPLTLMLGPVEDMLARSFTELSPAAKEQLEVVNRNGLRLLRLVNSLLDFSRIEAGRIRATYQPTDLAAFTTDLASVFRAAVERAGLSLVVDCPKLSGPVVVDRDMWEKIVLNLLSNAFKFTFDGEIVVTLGQAGQTAELRVKDTGTGIPPTEMTRLFERFHRVQNARGRTHEGSGIGLALVQELVKLHGGSIVAESTVGQGTTFTVSIPLGADHLSPEHVGTERGLASLGTGANAFVEEALRWLPDERQYSGDFQSELPNYQDPMPTVYVERNQGESDGRPYVLIADDNADMRQYVARLLAERYRVEAMPDGEAALVAVKKRHPDLILSDVMMPRLDGFGLLRRLRDNHETRNIPVIMLSARAGEESRIEGMEAGADDYLVKPFGARELLARVSAHLQIASLRREAHEVLQAREAELREAQRVAHVGSWHWDAKTDVTTGSDELFRIYGIDPATQAFPNFKDQDGFLYPHGSWQRIRDAARHTLQTGVGYEVDVEAFQGGEPIWVTTRSEVVRGAEGEISGLRGTVQNITDRKTAEEALRTSELRYRQLVEQMTDGIFVANEEGRYIEVSPAGCEMLGMTRDEVLGMRLTDLIVPEEHHRVAAEVARFNDGSIIRSEWHCRRKGGTVFIGELIGRKTSDGKIQGVLRDITEQKHAEQELRKREERLRRLTDLIPFGAWATNTDGEPTYMSRLYLEMLGQTFEEHKRSWPDTLHPDDVSEAVRKWRAFMQAGGTWEHEYRVRGKDGNYRTILARGFPVRDGEGRITGYVGLNYDISAQKQIEETLRQRVEEAHKLLDTLPIGVFFAHDPECRRITGNRAGHDLLRLPFASNLSKTAHAGEQPTHFRVCRDGVELRADQLPVQKAARGENVRNEEIEHVFDDGSIVSTLVSAAPLLDSQGQVRGAVASVLDVTELRLVEQSLRQSEERFRTLADNMSQFAWMADETGWIFWYNRRWYEYTGTTLEQMQGWGWKAVHHPDHVDRVVKRIRHSWDTGELWEDTFPLRGADGNYRWFLSRAVPIRDAEGRIHRWFGTNTDITEHRELEQELKDANQKMNEFLSILAHELRNPLAPIRNGLQLMKLAKYDANAIEQARIMMERQLNQMVRLIDDLMDLTRIRSGKITLKKTRMPLAAAVQNAVETSRPLVEAAGHDLILDVPDEPIFVDADETRLSQVIANLLNNAAKYTERGGRIRLAVERQGSDVAVTVEDNGVGIPAHMLPRIFDMFTQVDRSLEKAQGGLGIGLNIVKRLVEMHGGTIVAESGGHGMGSRFIVRLPVMLALANEQSGDEAQEKVAPTARRRILVVDDNRDSAISLAMMLKLMGNDTQTAHDGLEALDVAAAFRPDVILLDIGMPKLNGYETARRIRQQPWGKAVVLVAVTGWGQEEDRRRSQEAGFNLHMVKPVEPAALEKLLANVEATTA